MKEKMKNIDEFMLATQIEANRAIETMLKTGTTRQVSTVTDRNIGLEVEINFKLKKVKRS